MKERAKPYDVPVAQNWEGSLKGLQDFKDSLANTRGIEGFVIRYNT